MVRLMSVWDHPIASLMELRKKGLVAPQAAWISACVYYHKDGRMVEKGRFVCKLYDAGIVKGTCTQKLTVFINTHYANHFQTLHSVHHDEEYSGD